MWVTEEDVAEYLQEVMQEIKKSLALSVNV
jgi:hypothetical protein